MRKILGEIQDGSFAREWVAEDDAGRPNFSRLQKEGQEHPIEAGRREAARPDELGGHEGDLTARMIVASVRTCPALLSATPIMAAHGARPPSCGVPLYDRVVMPADLGAYRHPVLSSCSPRSSRRPR